MVFVELGCGDNHLAIERAVGLAVPCHVTLLGGWIVEYAVTDCSVSA
jgi:hypothetical protein